ncbi:RidA family protein [Amorphus orientalis]|uniref:Enamine deaminase RidA (YjgF/YER057c/UK114 family) n=1 Tax=Amorphus orientalis TaxID=649198 RepID=A0AAE4ARM2_9HYPH|nr:RidA family protein [Amorphus orientalis]MDQ0314218.1 enamine deaminase RidA (YjgF/YER057c/UK114 family) [Amorphus orientalis]
MSDTDTQDPKSSAAPARLPSPLEAVQPEGWPAPRGYANGMIGAGRVLFVGGQIGWDTEGKFPDGFLPQVGQALRNILDVVEAAGGGPEHIARLTWYVTDMEAYRASLKELGPVYRSALGKHFPAMALVQVVSLVETEALVEIEATAVIPETAG